MQMEAPPTMDTSSITTNELLVILDVTRRLAERRMVQPLLEYIASTVFEIIPAERCIIIQFGSDGSIHVQIARDLQGHMLPNAEDQMSRSVLERVRTTMSPLVAGDAREDALLKGSQSVRALGLRSVMCVPLISFGQAIGAIYVENRSASRGRFREDNLVPLVLFSYQVVVALENARLYEALEARINERTRELQEANERLARHAAELREQSIRDGLTGLYNRRYFTEILSQLSETVLRYQRPLAILCIDIDNFKNINDTLLHEGGDRVLVHVAQLLREHTRTADTLARIGGEEFALAMPETNLEAAILSAERLRNDIANYAWHELSPDLTVTISTGVASSNHDDAYELFRQADARLYVAKRTGKNRVISATVD